jgi:hypothetical protein
MLIECCECKARVDGEIVAYHEHEYAGIFSIRTYLLKCPSCNSALVGESEQDVRDGKLFWPDLTRVFPKPRRLLGSGIPDMVKKSIDEAERCVQAGAFLAATAMCGRALEAICRHYGTKDTYLGAGLKELRDKGIIDARLFQWSEELRDQRNMAAHATDQVISAQDARDVLSFTYAIIDYVFLLAMKFEQFQKRKDSRKNEKQHAKSTKSDI